MKLIILYYILFYNTLNNVLLNYFTKANVNISKINTNLKGNLKKK